MNPIRAQHFVLACLASCALVLAGCETEENGETDTATDTSSSDADISPIDTDDGDGDDTDVEEVTDTDTDTEEVSDTDTDTEEVTDTTPDTEEVSDTNSEEVSDTETTTEPCDGECGTNEVCDTSGEVDVCVCDDGFVDLGEGCVDPCDGTCGENEECQLVDEEETTYDCVCPDGYVDTEEACVYINYCEPPTMDAVGFEHASDEADPDCITDTVCLGRDTNGPVYNTLVDDGGFVDDCIEAPEPSGTLWKMGSCLDPGGEFTSIGRMVLCNEQYVIGKLTCMYIPAEERYFDVEWIQWGVNEDGPGANAIFEYTRTEVFPPCGLGADCADVVGGRVCTCPVGMSGSGNVYCTDTDACAGDPCGEGNTCQATAGGGYACVCEGQTVDFEKENGGAGEDCIYPDLVCLAREPYLFIYNSLFEDFEHALPDANYTPRYTWWAKSPCDEATLEDFGSFGNKYAVDGDGWSDETVITDVVGCVIVGPTMDSGVWLDIDFSAWGLGEDGFAYTRDLVTFDEACPVLTVE
jgi:hypothetical protein